MSLTDILHVNVLFPRIGIHVICFAFKRQRNVPSLITKPKMIHLEQIKVKSTQMDSISKDKNKTVQRIHFYSPQFKCCKSSWSSILQSPTDISRLHELLSLQSVAHQDNISLWNSKKKTNPVMERLWWL